MIARIVTAWRVWWLQVRRTIALREIAKARRAGIRGTQTLREWARQADEYGRQIVELQGGIAREPVSSAPTTMAFGNEAAEPQVAFADSGSALPSSAPRMPRRSALDATDGIFKTVLVGLALLFLLLIAWHVSPQVAQQLWGA